MKGTASWLLRMWILIIAGILVAGPFAVAAEDTSTSQAQEALDTDEEKNQVIMNIGDMTVKAKKVNHSADLPGSVDIIGEDEIAKQEADTALDILRIVPGFAVGDYNSGSVPNGFTMRGFGTGGHGQHTLITIDGIPYNYPFGPADGAADLTQLSVDDIESIEVVKGPIDAQYGNWCRAGSVHFNTRKRGDFGTAKLAYGSFDTKKGFASIGSEHFDNKFNQVYVVEAYDTEGYRDSSDYERQNIYGKWFYRPSQDLQIGLIAHAFSADWDAAGYLTEPEWEADPTQSVMDDDGGYTDMAEIQLHADWDINENTPLTFKFWYQDVDYSRFSTYGGNQTEGHFEHNVYGALMNLGYDMPMAQGQNLRFDVGFDYRNYDTDETKYNTTSQHRDSQSRDYDYNLFNFGIYAKANWDPSEMLRLFAGGRFDTFDGDFTNRLTDISMDLSDYNIWTYSAGVIYTFLPNYSIYANVGTGFQLPKNEAKYASDAPDESNFIQYEGGIKASPIEQIMIRYAYFYSVNDDEITGTYDSIANEWGYSYQGETVRKGHEIEINLMPLENLQFFGAYTYQEATYEDDSKSYYGNHVSAIPESILKLGVEYIFPTNTSLRVWYNKVGKWYTRSDNTDSYGGYDVVDLKIAHTFSDQWTISFDVKNLFDETYSEYVSNWSGYNQYSGSDGRYLQLTVKYTF